MSWSIIFKICLVISLIIPEACNNHQAEQSKNYLDLIAGTWELRKTSAAMVPGEKVYESGNGNTLRFANHRYERYENGTMVKTGKFEIVSDSTVDQSVCLVMPVGQFKNRIIYDADSTSDKVFIQISNNRLTFISGCYAVDAGHRSEYEKQD